MIDMTSQEDLRVQALNFEDKLIVHGVILHNQIRSSNQTIRKRQKAEAEGGKQKAEGIDGVLKTEANAERYLAVAAGPAAAWSKEENIRRTVRP